MKAELLLTRHLPGPIVDTCVERILCGPARLNLFENELYEICIPIRDGLLHDVDGAFLARPDGLPRRAISVKSRAAGRHPVAQTLTSLCEVAMPSERC